MEIIARRELPEHRLPNRIIQKALGKDALSTSGGMTKGFGRNSKESGPIETHRYAEETCDVFDPFNACVRFGRARDELDKKTEFEAGITLYIAELE